MITSKKHLLFILGLKEEALNRILNNIDQYYYSWEKIKYDKKTNQPLKDSLGNNLTRTLNSTHDELKRVQKKIYLYLLRNTTIPSYCYGGIKGTDNIMNARYHQGNKYVFTTDLKSFFPSISHSDVFQMFLSLGCTPSISRILTQLTTKDYQLPQGVPTSTLLANLIFKSTGDKIENIARYNNLKFSIFVDDVTISSSKDFKFLVDLIISIIKDDGYKISHKKTHYQTKNPTITGVICQNNKLKIPNIYNKRIKQLSHDEKKTKHQQNQLKGLLNYRQRIKSL